MRYFIAKQMRMAENIILVELPSWKRVARLEFIDADGEAVQILDGSKSSIAGRRFDRIYLASGWDIATSESVKDEIFALATAFNARVTYVYRDGEMHDA